MYALVTTFQKKGLWTWGVHAFGGIRATEVLIQGEGKSCLDHINETMRKEAIMRREFCRKVP